MVVKTGGGCSTVSIVYSHIATAVGVYSNTIPKELWAKKGKRQKEREERQGKEERVVSSCPFYWHSVGLSPS